MVTITKTVITINPLRQTYFFSPDAGGMFNNQYVQPDSTLRLFMLCQYIPTNSYRVHPATHTQLVLGGSSLGDKVAGA